VVQGGFDNEAPGHQVQVGGNGDLSRRMKRKKELNWYHIYLNTETRTGFPYLMDRPQNKFQKIPVFTKFNFILGVCESNNWQFHLENSNKAE